MNTILLELKAIKTVFNLRKKKKKTLPQALVSYTKIPLEHYSLMTPSQRAACPNLLNRVAACLGESPKAVIYYLGTEQSAFMPILHEFAHVILGHLEDNPQQERDANLFTVFLIKWYYAARSTVLRYAALATLVSAFFIVPLWFPDKPVEIILPEEQKTLTEYISVETELPLVFITKTGTVYHAHTDCQYIIGKNQARIEEEQAKLIGYSLCAACEGRKAG